MTTILVTGATGYMFSARTPLITSSLHLRTDSHSGGSVFRYILKRPTIQTASVSALDLEDLAMLEEVSTNSTSDFDVAINRASGFHPTSAVALIKGLAKRKRENGKETSGTSNLGGDYRVTGAYTETRIFSDKDHIYAYVEYRRDMGTYPQRTTDLAMLSIQIPTLMQTAMKVGYAKVVGAGNAHWSHAHMADLASLHEALLRDAREDGGPYVRCEGYLLLRDGEAHVVGFGREGCEGCLGFAVPLPGRITLEQAARRWGNACLLSRTPAIMRNFEESYLEEFKLIQKEGQQE
ncbi:hypothetical protein BDW71DRAFT_201548 [Aspergillus fruticulosus]